MRKRTSTFETPDRQPAGMHEPDVDVSSEARLSRRHFLTRGRRVLHTWTRPLTCKPAMQGTELVLNYLGRYVHRIAWTKSRILSTEDGQVSFRYQDDQDQRWKI